LTNSVDPTSKQFHLFWFLAALDDIKQAFIESSLYYPDDNKTFVIETDG